MVYMGGKQKISKYIVPIINRKIKEEGIEHYYEPFTGGMNIGAYIECKNIYANDLSPTLIELHKQAQEDFSLVSTDSSRENWDRCYTEYKRMKKHNFNCPTDFLLADIGAIEWLGSFSGRGFPGGYGVESKGRNQFNERLENLRKQSQTVSYQRAIFTNNDYRKLKFKPNSLIYSDAPYKNTKTYGINTKFNYSEYYKWLMETAKTTPIFISEQDLPAEIPAQVVWEKEVKRDIDKNSKKATEKLFYLDLR